ncbi:hypothetical protein P8452_78052 [Trifolium repens]|nr:hypothetical protein P8452_78052 [Trifolium repens]
MVEIIIAPLAVECPIREFAIMVTLHTSCLFTGHTDNVTRKPPFAVTSTVVLSLQNTVGIFLLLYVSKISFDSTLDLHP